MKLRRRRGSYRVAPIGELLAAHIRIDDYDYELVQTDVGVIEKARASEHGNDLGVPVMVAVKDCTRLLVHPLPAKAYKVNLVFYPPIESQ